jgi:hypothetical protein
MTQVRNKSGGNLIQKLRFALFFTGVAVYMRVLVRVVATRG